MITDTTVYNVKNRSASNVVYRIPDTGVRREFVPGETKRIAFSELQSLTNIPGGKELLTEFLQIEEKVADTLAIPRELEYKMSEQDVVRLIKLGSLESFQDAIDFAPIGIIDLIKTLAIQLPMTDPYKKKALKEMTGFDVDAALRHVEEEKMEEESMKNAPSEKSNGQRRVQPSEPARGQRRAAVALEESVAPVESAAEASVPKYNFVD